MSRSGIKIKLLLQIIAAICFLGGLSLWLFSGGHPPPAPTAGDPKNVPGTDRPPRPRPASTRPGNRSIVDLLPADLRGINAESSDEELLAAARNLVAQSPEQTLAWAQAQTDPAFRERLLFAVLRAWGERDPRAAVNWALRQDENSRLVYVEAAFTGAVAQPEVFAVIGRELLAADPDSAVACRMILVGVLSGSEKFQLALQFANEGPAESRADGLANIFHRWGENKPEEAVLALATITDPSLHDGAYESLISGWARGNPSSLAAYALTQPAGDNRVSALNAALENWCVQDPAAMGEWLNALPSSPELDRAVSWLITRTDSVNRSPEVATTWLPEIQDSTLRREALVHLMQEWAQADASAAWKYFKNIPWLEETERPEIQKSIEKKIELAHTNPDRPN